VSVCRQQGQIDAPVETVWALVGDPNRHPEWWPRIVEVQCEGIEQGCTYRRVFQSPMGKVESTILLEELDDCRQVLIRCLDTGTFAHVVLTESRGGTFVDVEAGMDPKNARDRLIDTIAGKRFYRRWIEQTLAALRKAASREQTAA
jgi:uncharacterized protein YndB with AHSA1/START domain